MSLSPKSKVSKKATKEEVKPEVKAAVEADIDEDSQDEEVHDEDSVGNSTSQKPAVELKVPLSQALLSKLKKSAEEEGILMTELAAELITEGLVLRAWEILERNQHIRGGSHPNNQQGGGQNNYNNQNHNQNRHNNQRNFNNNNNHRNNRNQNRQQNNMNIMQDKAAFLEYVRNQERKRR